jgi:hypothetical protein
MGTIELIQPVAVLRALGMWIMFMYELRRKSPEPPMPDIQEQNENMCFAFTTVQSIPLSMREPLTRVELAWP